MKDDEDHEGNPPVAFMISLMISFMTFTIFMIFMIFMIFTIFRIP